MKWQGLKELDGALGELSKATAKAVCIRALKKGAQPIADTARDLAPKKTERLAKSIKVTTLKPKGHASKATYAQTLREGGTKAQAAAAQRAYNRDNPGSFAEVFVAPDQFPEAWPQEIGTSKHPPHPYLRPALAQHQQDSVQIIANELKAETAKAAERARRKALRKAGKG